MEDSVLLVCEALGVCEVDEVTAEDVCVFYQRVFLRQTNTELIKKIISWVTGRDGGVSCSAGKVAEVLLELEREKEAMEELYWDIQMLQSGEAVCKISRTPCCIISQNGVCVCEQKLQLISRRLNNRFLLAGFWNVLPSLRHGKQDERRKLWTSPPSVREPSLLLQHKYDIIRERLYAEMLQHEYGGLWWENLSSWQQQEHMCEVAAWVERAVQQGNLLSLCDLPGALRCYRTSDRVTSAVCPEENGQAWTAMVFLTELDSLQQQEKTSLSALINRLDWTGQAVVCMHLKFAVMKVERETDSYRALLAARQDWDEWPRINSDVSREQLILWLEYNQDPPVRSYTHFIHTIQDSILEQLLTSQELERRSLIHILYGISGDELQEPRGDLQLCADSLREACVLRLCEMKNHLLAPEKLSTDALWVECAFLLLQQLIHKHQQQSVSVLHNLSQAQNTMVLHSLHKHYECELQRPHLSNLHTLLLLDTSTQPHTHREREDNPAGMWSEATEHKVTPEIGNGSPTLAYGDSCTEEGTPYLHIRCGRSPNDEVTGAELFEGQASLIAVAWSNRTELTNQDPAASQQEPESKETITAASSKSTPDTQSPLTHSLTTNTPDTHSCANHTVTTNTTETPGTNTTFTLEQDNEETHAKPECTHTHTPLLQTQSLLYTDNTDQGTVLSHSVCAECVGEESMCVGGVFVSEESVCKSVCVGEESVCVVGVCVGEESVSVDGVFVSKESVCVDGVCVGEESVSVDGVFVSKESVCVGEECVCVGESVCVDGLSVSKESVCVDGLCVGEESVCVGESVCVDGVCVGEESVCVADSVCVGEESVCVADSVCVGEESVGESVCVDGVCVGEESVCESVWVEPLQREQTMQSLVDIQRKLELHFQREKERHTLRVQERLSIIQNRKNDEETPTLRDLRRLTQEEDEELQKVVVRERLEQLRRERSYILQTRRERNTTGFKELLGPTAQHTLNTED